MVKRPLLIAACQILLTGSLLLFGIFAVTAQNDHDPFYWKQDTTLLAKLDTVPMEQVTAEINTRLNQILAYLSAGSSPLLIDSITNWNNTLRWAVILNSPGSTPLIDSIAEMAAGEDRGHWQYYFVYMTLWASFLNSTGNITETQKISHILEKYAASGSYIKNFYEDRLLDMGPTLLPSLISYARDKIIPKMDQLDKEMQAEEDLVFYNAYYHFIDLINMLCKTGDDRQLFLEMLKDKDTNVQRFARDVLDSEQ